MTRIFALLAVCTLTACSQAEDDVVELNAVEAMGYGDEPNAGGGEQAADAVIPEPPAPAASPLTYRGYSCTSDCSGHAAGYAWAEDHEISDPDDCGGKSQSFIEGCESYAEEARYSEREVGDAF